MRVVFLYCIFFLMSFSQSFASETQDDISIKKELAERTARIQKEIFNTLLIQREDIVGVEMVIAAGTKDAIFSRYGHALLRFVNKNGPWTNDIMISFVADVGFEEISYKKGLNGGYKTKMEAYLISKYWNEYIIKGGRSLSRYIIPMTREQITNLIDQVEIRIKNPKLLGNYKLLSKNCATSLTQLLIDSGLPHSKDTTNLPTSLPKWLKKSSLSIHPPLIVKEKRSIFVRAQKLLNLSDEDFNNGVWPTDADKVILDNFSVEEIKVIYNEIVMIPPEVFLELVKVANYQDSNDFDQIYGFKKMEDEIYRKN